MKYILLIIALLLILLARKVSKIIGEKEDRIYSIDEVQKQRERIKERIGL